MKPKQNINPNDIHTAVATWSGFIYQGKIALLHVLRLLNDKKFDIENCLQLDSIEDFAIVDNEIDLNPLTIHQVKAMKSKSYGEYKEAFDKLEKRLKKFPCNGAFFHLAVDNEKTPLEIKTIHPNLSIYEYSVGQSSCRLEYVNDWIEKQITNYLNINLLGHHCGNESLVRNHLEAEIFNQVISIHANNHEKNGLRISEGAYYFVIPFTKFISILKIDPSTLLGGEFYVIVVKELLNTFYTEFCTEQEELAVNPISDNVKLKLDGYLQQINSLSNSKLLEFLKKLVPDRIFRLENLKDFVENNISKDGFKDAFMTCLFELRQSDVSINSGLTWLDIESRRYSATAIVSNQTHLNQICLRIYNNILNTDFEIPYESDFLITSGLENNSMIDTLNHHFNVPENDAFDINKKNNITKWSTVSLVDVKTAKSKII